MHRLICSGLIQIYIKASCHVNIFIQSLHSIATLTLDFLMLLLGSLAFSSASKSPCMLDYVSILTQMSRGVTGRGV